MQKKRHFSFFTDVKGKNTRSEGLSGKSLIVIHSLFPIMARDGYTA